MIFKNKRKSLDTQAMASTMLLCLSDIFVIFFSLSLAVMLTNQINYSHHFYEFFYKSHFAYFPVYFIVMTVFLYDGLYSNRFDFWHESRLVFSGLLLSFVLVLAYVTLTENTQYYAKNIIIYSFALMTLMVPLSKKILKNTLFKLGLWKLGVKVLSEDSYLQSEIFNNSYLGYIKSKREKAQIVFVDSFGKDTKSLNVILYNEIQLNNKVIFIPVFHNYHFRSSDIFELTNVRTNLVVLENRLKSKYRIFITKIYNYILSILLLPILLPIIGVISALIKLDSDGPVFFKQKRLGQNSKIFYVYKFRTMYVDSQTILDNYLKENPQEITNYSIFHKYENDPRITRIGKYLRNTSLDELAQLFNIVYGDMNFIGPRPYMIEEKKKIGKLNENIILKVKPGISGLWQVSGRNELTFEERINLDKWYIQNWSLWMDFVIFLKTINVVLNKIGAK